MRIADKSGNPIHGLFRDKSHAVVVNDQAAYTKYIKEKERIEEISRLRSDVDEIKSMLSQILKAVNGSTNI